MIQTRQPFSRRPTARLLIESPSWSIQGGTPVGPSGGIPAGPSRGGSTSVFTSGGYPSWSIWGEGRGVLCYLSHNALDVTSLLSRHQMMGLAWCTCLYSVAPKHYGKVTWDPPPEAVLFHDHFHDHFCYHFCDYFWEVPCDLSHNALDVISLLSRHQMMGLA